jgi:cytochrome P450
MEAQSSQGLGSKVTKPDHVPQARVVDWDMYNPPGIENGLYESWMRLQEPGVPDIVWTPRNGGHWIATRGKWIAEMFKDFEHFSSKCIWLPKEAGEQYTFIPTSMDPPEQTPYRELINSGIGLRVVRGIEESIRTRARALIDGFYPRGECNFTTEYAEPFPIGVFLAMVNLPMADAPRLKVIADQITRPDGSLSMADASEKFFQYLQPWIVERRLRPGKDAISQIVNGDFQGRKLNDYEAQRVCGLLLLAGLDTVVNFLSFAILFLAQSPEHRRKLAADSSLIPSAVEEFFRRLPLVADGRLIAEDIECDGVMLKAGEMILLPTMLHGLDERENECPMQVDFSRKKISHSFFGGGAHRCAGLHVARAEVTITLEEWLKKIPEFDTAPDFRPRYHSGVVSSLESLPLRWKV